MAYRRRKGVQGVCVHCKLMPDQHEAFKKRIELLGITQSEAIREALEHCGFIPRRVMDLRAKAFAIGAAVLPSVNGEFVEENRRKKYMPEHPQQVRSRVAGEPSLKQPRPTPPQETLP